MLFSLLQRKITVMSPRAEKLYCGAFAAAVAIGALAANEVVTDRLEADNKLLTQEINDCQTMPTASCTGELGIVLDPTPRDLVFESGTVSIKPEYVSAQINEKLPKPIDESERRSTTGISAFLLAGAVSYGALKLREPVRQFRQAVKAYKARESQENNSPVLTRDA